VRWKRKDGGEIIVSLYARTIRDARGRVMSYEGVVVDSIARTRMENALQQAARYRTFFENANDMMATFTLEGIITSVNRGLEVALGWSRDELIGRHYCKLAPPQALALADDRTSRALAGEELPSIFAAEMLRKDGTVVPIEVRSRFIRDAEGNPTGIQGVFRDLTERRRADAALRESEAHLRTLVNAAPVLLWRAGLDAGRTFFNQQWLAFTGRTLEQEHGSGWLAGMHPEDVPPYQERYLTAFHARQPFCLDYRLRRADGVYRWVLETGVPHHTAEGAFAGYMGAGLDITERKQAEADLRESQRLFQQLADTIPDLLYLYDVVEQRTIYLNRQFATVLGYTPDELQAMGPEVWRTLLHPDDVAQFAASHPRVATAQVGDLPEVQYRLRHANGEWRWLKSRERVFSHTATGTPTQLLGIAQDITTHKRMRELLAEQPTQRPEVADNLRRFRESLDLSQTEFGRAFGGYSQRQISSYESGESEVPLALLLDIRAKGYPFEVILGASSTAALTKTVGALSASQQRHTLARQLADALVRLLDRDSLATDTVLHSLGLSPKSLEKEHQRVLAQIGEADSGGE
jgi:PAS domain S-box-containing protein